MVLSFEYLVTLCKTSVSRYLCVVIKHDFIYLLNVWFGSNIVMIFDI